MPFIIYRTGWPIVWCNNFLMENLPENSPAIVWFEEKVKAFAKYNIIYNHHSITFPSEEDYIAFLIRWS